MEYSLARYQARVKPKIKYFAPQAPTNQYRRRRPCADSNVRQQSPRRRGSSARNRLPVLLSCRSPRRRAFLGVKAEPAGSSRTTARHDADPDTRSRQTQPAFLPGSRLLSSRSRARRSGAWCVQSRSLPRRIRARPSTTSRFHWRAPGVVPSPDVIAIEWDASGTRPSGADWRCNRAAGGHSS